MTAPAHPSRKSSLRDMVSRIPKSPGNNGDGPGHLPTSAYFGINTFGARQMRDKLPKDVYAKLVAAIRHGKKLDLEIAPTVAQVIKEWAIVARRDALHALVPAADRAHRREARRLPRRSTTNEQPIEQFTGGAAHPERARRVELPVGRPARDVGSARLHGVEPGEPGVHRRVGRRAHAVHPVGVHRLQRRSARRDDAAAPQLRRPLRARRSSCSSCSATRACSASTRRSAPSRSTSSSTARTSRCAPTS